MEQPGGRAVPDDPTFLCSRNCSASYECFFQASKASIWPDLGAEPWNPSETNFRYTKQVTPTCGLASVGLWDQKAK